MFPPSVPMREVVNATFEGWKTYPSLSVNEKVRALSSPAADCCTVGWMSVSVTVSTVFVPANDRFAPRLVVDVDMASATEAE